MTLADQLRAAIRAHHDAIEETPLAVAMIRGTVTRDAYAVWLRQMGHLHAGLEQTLADCSAVAAVYSPVEMTRSGLLERDMAEFGVTDAPPSEPVARLTEQFTKWRVAAPWKLIGALYVLEGSRMGSMVLLRPLAGAFGVTPRSGAGLDYHLDGIATRPQKWQQFRTVLSTLPLTEPQRADVTAAAVETMRALCELYASERFAHEPAAAVCTA